LKAEHNLESTLQRIDGKGYKAYKDIKGAYQFPHFYLFIDHVQGDPFANPSRIRTRVDRIKSGLPADMSANRSRTIALCDFLTRRFYYSCRKIARGNRGTGKSGLITIDKPGQEILERSSMIITPDFVEARLLMGLPGYGRGVSGRDARAMFFDELPRIVNASLLIRNLDRRKAYRHIETAEDTDVLRNRLKEMGCIGFVANGSLLPRVSGVDPQPMDKKRAVFFKSPANFDVQVELPNCGRIDGMGIPKGVSLIVGGGYHGKSTLLNALELGIYNHIPDDGREKVVTVSETVKIRAADGRNIEKTDISPFINNLPFGKATDAFSTGNASGSTSQAANISEAIEAGARVLLLDEDTSATNFMIRDYRMQQLVSKDKEPITPFIDKVRQLYTDKGISTVVVMGGSGDYFSVADHILLMTEYLPSDVTQKAHDIATSVATGRLQEGGRGFGTVKQRIPILESFDPFVQKNRVKISAARTREIVFGKTAVDLGDMEQIVDISQTRAMGLAIHYATRYMDGHRTLREIVALVSNDMDRKGLDILSPYIVGDLARFRDIELAAAINRMRTLRMTQKG
jgi:predicted ABC-class ATPase